MEKDSGIGGQMATVDTFIVGFAELAAKRLAGRPLQLRLEKPPAPYDDCDGIAYRSGDSGIVYVNPALDDGRFLYVLCHEAAHIRAHWRTTPPIEEGAPLPAPRRPGALSARFAAAREGEADAMAAKWAAAARRHGKGTLITELAALALLPGEELDAD